jgi:hypothetical protein
MIVENMRMRRGDLKPDLIVDLFDEDLDMDISLSLSTKVIGKKNGAVLFNRPGALVGDSAVKMEWQAADTLTPGTISVEVEIMWPGNKPQTVRADNDVVVYPDYA